MSFRPFPFLPRQAIPSVLAMLLAGCATSSGKLAVDLKALKECQRLGGPVSPPPISPDSDYRDLAPEALGQLHKANQRDAARSSCEEKVIKDYASANRKS